jgi:hypothetical protein
MKSWLSVGFAGLSLLLIGCLQGGVIGYKPDAKFVALYTDLKLASIAVGPNMDKASEIRRVILTQHGMTPAEFHEHFMQLAEHPEAWKPFQEQVVARIDAFQKNRKGAPNGQ